MRRAVRSESAWRFILLLLPDLRQPECKIRKSPSLMQANPDSPAPTAASPALRRGLFLLAGDLFAFPVAWVLAVTTAYWAGKADTGLFMPLASPAGVLFSLGAVLTVFVFALNGQYTLRSSYWEEVRLIWRNLVTLALFNFSLSFFIQVSYTRTVVVLAWGLTLLLVPLARLVVREALHRKGWWCLPALVVGDGQFALGAAQAIADERHLGLYVAARIDSTDAGSIEAKARALGCRTLVLAPEAGADQSLAKMINALHPWRFELFVVPPISGLPVQGLQAQHFLNNDTLMLRVRQNLFSRRSQWTKRLADITLASLALVVLSPLFAWVALRIWQEDRGPVLFTHRRIGRGGREFDFIKFRSMRSDADAALERWKIEQPALYSQYVANNFKLADDPRVLRTGRWIRRTSIDELPQLWNVLRGDMSLVGPRPLLARELNRYPADTLELYAQVRPGITGLWQVSGRSETTFAQRAELDAWYVRNWSLWLDWIILLKTFTVVATGRGAV